MANNSNLIKYVYRIYSNGIVAGSCTVFFIDIIAHNVYFVGFDVELLERAGLLREVMSERDRDNTGDTQFMDFVIILSRAPECVLNMRTQVFTGNLHELSVTI